MLSSPSDGLNTPPEPSIDLESKILRGSNIYCCFPLMRDTVSPWTSIQIHIQSTRVNSDSLFPIKICLEYEIFRRTDLIGFENKPVPRKTVPKSRDLEKQVLE